ncbi:MAG: HAD hydrolase-like protein [Oscillospiraceae bacterium]
MNEYKYIFFDLDGTITNSEEGITKSVQYALKKFGIDEDRKCLTPFIGPPLSESFKEIYGFDDKKIEKAIEYFREYFSQKGIKEHSLYEGMDVLFPSLKDSGKTIVLATSKPEIFARNILDQYDITKYFDYICGASFDEARSSKSDVLRYAIETVSPDSLSACVMVGDRKYDVLGAKEVGMETIGVAFGFGGHEELEAAGAKFVVDTVSELASVLLNKA